MKTQRRPKRRHVLPFLGVLMFLGVGLGAAPKPKAPTRLIPTFPSATSKAMQGAEGAPWDLIRRNGLILTVEGEGAFDLVMFAFAVQNGRVTNRWNSRSRLTVLAGKYKLSGSEFLPNAKFSAGGTFGSDASFLAGDGFVSAADAQAAYESSSVSVFLDRRRIKEATGVLLVAMPACDGASKECRDVETRPVAAMPKLFGDP